MGDTKGLSRIKEPDPWSQVPLTFDPSVPGDQTELKTLSKGHKEIGEELDEDIVRKKDTKYLPWKDGRLEQIDEKSRAKAYPDQRKLQKISKGHNSFTVQGVK